MAILGIGQKHENQVFLDKLLLSSMGDRIVAYEKLPKEKQGLKDENEFWYRQSLMNLTVRFPPDDLGKWYYTNFVKNLNPSSIKAFRSWYNEPDTNKPLSIAEAENRYSGGWVGFQDFWDEGVSVGGSFKNVAPVIGGIVAGGLAGGPVGAVIGAIGGVAKYAADAKASKASNVEFQKLSAATQIATAKAIEEQDNIAKASMDLVSLKGPQLWALGILLILGLIILFRRK